jgi:hypothetical protein
MKARSTITILLVLLMTSSIFVVNTAPTTDTNVQSRETPQAPQTIAEAPSISAPQILVYTEFVDSRTDQEYENTMSAINNTYGTNYQQTNLTDYNNLDTYLPGKDILLIPEQELATITTMKNVGANWSSTLTDFVNNGGVVVMLDFGNVTAPGLGLHIYNQSGLMQFGPVLGQYPSAALMEMNRFTFGDALARKVKYRWVPQSNTFAVTTTDGAIAFADYDTDSPVCVHKTMGKGHVVFLGFDMQYSDPYYEQIVGNSIRLPNHVVFDYSQQSEYTWLNERPDQYYDDDHPAIAFVEDLVEAGFAVSRMDTFDAAFLNASDVLVCPLPKQYIDEYEAAEIAILDAYVANGGSIFIQSDWSTYGDDIRALANNFGYDWARDDLWDTDDAMNWYYESQIAYTGDNILSHPITYNVSRVEFYAVDGFTTLPVNAERIIVTDWDKTSCWGEGGWYDNWLGADGITLMAVSNYGAGKVSVVLDSNFMDSVTYPTDEDQDNDGVLDYFDSDNDVLLLNTIHWLAGKMPANDAPLLAGMTHTPAIDGNQVNVTVTATDSDGLANITCHYRLDTGDWYNVSMTHEGAGVYSAEIGTFYDTDFHDYYIRAFDNSADQIESVTSVVHLNGINYLPTTPMLYDPGTTDDDGIFLLNWTASSDTDGYVDHYEIQMSDSSLFTTILDEFTAFTDDYDMTLFDNGAYYFRVRAVDDNGTAGFWCFPQNLFVSITANSPPAISSLNHSPIVPMNGFIVTISANILDTDGIDNATCYYRVNSGSWTPVTMVPGIGDEYYADIGSFEEKDFVEYYVSAFDNSTDSLESVSSTGSFEVYNMLPDIPVLNNPGTLDDDGVFLLNWTESTDEDGFVDHYEIQMSDSGTFSTILDQWTTTTNETWVSVSTNGMYYFRVKALDDHGEYAGFSNVVSIEVNITEDLIAPVIATLYTDPVEPIQGDVVTVKADVLDFTGIDNVTCSYRVNSGSWTSILMVNTIGDLFEVSIGSFSVDDFIEVSVQAWDNSTNHNTRTSAFSCVIENQAPLAPDLLDPGTTIPVSHFIANWTAGSDHEGAISHYQFQVSISSEFATIFGEWNITDLSFNVTGLSNGVYYLRVRTIDDHDAPSEWSDVESIEVELSTTSETIPPNPTTSPTANDPFDPDVLNLVFLVVTVGSFAVILLVVVAIIRQRSSARSQYKF